MELINGVLQSEDDGLILEIMAKYPPYYKSSDRAKWPRINGRLGVGGSGSGVSSLAFSDFTSSFTGENRTVIDANGLMKTLPASVVAIDHVGASLTPMLRLEPAGTNLLFNSNTFTAAAGWTLQYTITTVQNAIGPDGTANSAWTITDSDAGFLAAANRAISKSASDSTTYFQESVSFAKTTVAATFPGVQIYLGGGTAKLCGYTVNTNTGVLTARTENNAGNIGASIVSQGNFWRVTIWCTDPGANTSVYFAVNPAVNTDASATWAAATQGSCVIANAKLTTGSIPSSYFAGAAAIGAELVTDGGFAAVTEGAELITNENDRTFAGASNWINVNIDSYDATGDLSLVSSASEQYCRLPVASAPQTPGKTYVIRFDLSGNTQGGWYIKDFLGNTISPSAVAGNGAKTIYYTPTEGTGGLRIAAVTIVSDGNFDNFSLKEITFTNWTAGTGWAPQAAAGALTGKAQKIAGTASALSQTTAVAEADNVYRIGHTAVRTAGTYTAEFGSTNGTAVAANGLYYDYIIAADTDYIKFNADASFAGSIDLATAMKHGTVRLSEANTVTLAMPAAITAALAATGTIVVDWMPAFNRAAGVVTGIISVDGNTASLLYTTTTAGNLSSWDGTTVAASTAAYTANVLHRLVAQWPSSANKYKVGASIAMAGVAYGSEANYDGAITAGANLVLAPTVYGPMYFKAIKFYNSLRTPAQINAM